MSEVIGNYSESALVPGPNEVLRACESTPLGGILTDLFVTFSDGKYKVVPTKNDRHLVIANATVPGTSAAIGLEEIALDRVLLGVTPIPSKQRGKGVGFCLSVFDEAIEDMNTAKGLLALPSTALSTDLVIVDNNPSKIDFGISIKRYKPPVARLAGWISRVINQCERQVQMRNAPFVRLPLQ